VGNFEQPAHDLPPNADNGVSLATWISELASSLLAVGSKRAGSGYLFILATDADTWARHYFFWNETCFPKY
jgi:hypothetical protein